MERDAVDRWMSARLGIAIADLPAGCVAVAASERCTHRERGFGFIRGVWAIDLGDRAAIAVHPSAAAEVARRCWALRPEDLRSEGFWHGVREDLALCLPGAEWSGPGLSVMSFHRGGAERIATDAELRLVVPGEPSPWPTPRVYSSAASHPSARDGEALELWLGDRAVAEIVTHEPCVADIAPPVVEDGIEVAEGFRGRGYGQALLAAWTGLMQERGRVCVHGTSAGNAASLAIGRAAGYLPYAESRALTWRCPEP